MMATYATTIGSKTAALLNAYPGHAFCDECLAGKLGVSLREVRHAQIVLAGSPEFEQQTWFCSVCLSVKHVIHVAWLRFDPAHLDDAGT